MNSAIYVRVKLLPVSFDPNALAMALQLADVIADDLLADWNSMKAEEISTWLRAEVQRELEQQP